MGGSALLGKVIVRDPVELSSPPPNPAASTAAWNSATAQNTALTLTGLGGYQTVVLSFSASGSIAAGHITFELDDGTGVWAAVSPHRVASSAVTDNGWLLTAANTIWTVLLEGQAKFRVRLDTVITGSGTVNIQAQPSVAYGGSPAVTIAGSANTQDAAGGNLGSSAPTRAIEVGSSATSTTPAVATAGNLIAVLMDLLGRLVVTPYALTDMLVSGTVANLATTTSTQILAAPAAGLRNYPTWIHIVNEHATVDTDVQLLDGNGGTEVFRTFAAHGGGGITIALPDPLKQPTTATRLDVKCVTTGANVTCSLGGHKGP
jgi:hypothetical protein